MTTAQSDEPILASWKISEVLQKHPELLDTLIDLSPAFGKLRNPLMRKVQTRLVTVAQAAAIAGLEPTELTRKLNEVAGITAPAGTSETEPSRPDQTEAPSWVASAPYSTEIDVRPLMARGEEPFKAIMAVARPVPAGAAFRLRAGFEPLPLYDVLARQGFTHWARQHGPDDWEIVFFRDHQARAQAQPASSKTSATRASADRSAGIDWDTPATSEVTIDVSDLVPPEPMIKILQTLETLPPDARLLVHHVRRPIHLYDRLDEMGYAHATREPAPGTVEVLIQKPGTTAS